MIDTISKMPPGFLVGNAQDADAGTGVTVLLHKQGAVGGVAVRGAAPATRETDLLAPENSVERIHAVVLSGGSAFGLEAASGVMRWLSEQGVGFELQGNYVPIVCGASLFDLMVGAPHAYPDIAMGYEVCTVAAASCESGNVGAGTGATVGKFLGSGLAMKAGLGVASSTLGDLVVTAVVAVNALGTVVDRRTDTACAGARNPDAPGEILSVDAALALLAQGALAATAPSTNTTIGCVLTNACLNKAHATHLANMTHDAYARAIEPVHTSMDGDAVFVMASGEQDVNSDVVGILATRVMEAAILDAVHAAKGAYGLPAARDI
ncbi:MAG: P1 family peptidase [Coriobacteriales bacterium]|jgi:L-aminopeptidase/D-esterase-like protein|nr:P1 family peptidase [Coriobacteriales bacterium]